MMHVTDRTSRLRTRRNQQRTPERNAARIILFCVILCSAPAVLDLTQGMSGLMLTLLVAVPVVVKCAIERRLMVADPVIVIGFMWMLAAGLPALAPALYEDPIWSTISPRALDAATLWFYRAWASASVAYWAFLAFAPMRRARPVAPIQLAREDQLRMMVGVVGMLAMLVFLVRSGGQTYTHLEGFASVSTVDQLIHELRHLSKVYVFLFFLARGQGRCLPIEPFILGIILAGYAMVFAGSASKAVALELAAMWLLGNAAGSSRGNLLREALIGLIAVLLIYWVFSFVTAYRYELVWRVDGPQTSLNETIDTQLAAAEAAFWTVWNGEPIGGGEEGYRVSAMFDRLALVSSFATMLDITNFVSPYENAAEAFLAPLYAFLPRALFDMKVQYFGSGEFAQLLGWQFGGFSVSLPGSFYWAWGVGGIAIASACIGFVLASLKSKSDGLGPAALVWRIALMSVVLYLMNVGMSFQPIIIGTLRALAVVLVLQYLVLPVMGQMVQRNSRIFSGGK